MTRSSDLVLLSLIKVREKKMSNMNVEHYLDIYQFRLQLQEEGVTNPPEETKALVRTICGTTFQTAFR
jgi:hypothetical protein